MKKIKYLSIGFLAVVMAACGGKDSNKNAEGDSTQTDIENLEVPTTEDGETGAPETDQKVEARSIDVNFDAEAVEGDLGMNILIVSEGETPSVHLEGIPYEEGYLGDIKATLKLNVSQNSDFAGLSSAKPLTLQINNEAGKSITVLTMSQDDLAKVVNALKTATTAEVIEVVYEGKVQPYDYNNVFDNAKSVKITGTEMSEVEKPEIIEDDGSDMFKQADWVKQLDSETGVETHDPYYVKVEDDGTYWRKFGNYPNKDYYVKALHNYDTEYNGKDVSGYKYYVEKKNSKTRFYFNPK